jgi:hypothetical protein
VANNNDFWIGWFDSLRPSITVTFNYSQLYQLTINDWLRLAQFLTGLRVPSLPLWLTWFWFTNWSLLQLPLSAGYYSTGEHSALELSYDWMVEPRELNCCLTLLESSLMLRPKVSWPVYLGIKHPSGAYDGILVLSESFRGYWYGAPSLTRGLVCRLQLLLACASAVPLGSESRGTRDILLSHIRLSPNLVGKVPIFIIPNDKVTQL